MRKHFTKNAYFIALIIIYILALLLRTLHLTTNPLGLYVDEAGLGYNSWCLVHYGVDRYLNEMPIYPENYVYSGQSPLYTYATALMIKIFGGNISILAIRLFGVITSMCVVYFGSKIIAMLTSKKWLILCGTLFISICPYAIMHGRLALDCNAMLGCCTIAFYTLLKALKTKRTRDFVFCGIACGIVLYSYALSYIIMALFLVTGALYLLFTGELRFKQAVLWALSVIITAFPIILFIVSVLFNLPSYKFLCFTISPVAAGRATELSLDNFLQNLVTSVKYSLTSDGFLFDAIPKYGTVYFTSIVFFIIGFLKALYNAVVSIKKRTYHHSMLFLLFYVAALFTCSLNELILIYRMNSIFIPILFFIIDGIYTTITFAGKYGKYVFLSIAVSYAAWLVSFANYYFHNPQQPNFLLLATDAIQYAQENFSYEKLIVDYNSQPEFLLFDIPISPYEWKEQLSYDAYGSYISTEEASKPGYVYIFTTANSHIRKHLDASDLTYTKIDFPSGYTLYFAE